MLKVYDIKKTFKNKKLPVCRPLNGVNFEIGAGEKVALLGKSGAGKSTVARILCGYTVPDEGQVMFEGSPLFDSRGRYDRCRGLKIQLVPQQPYASLDPAQTIGSALAEALRVSKRARSHSEAKNKSEALLEKVGLEKDILRRLPSQLSGGQAQRITIARALASEPKLLICDEATSMLDVPSQAQIVGLLNKLAESDGLSVLLITHDETLARAFTGRAYRLSDGILNECIFNREKECYET